MRRLLSLFRPHGPLLAAGVAASLVGSGLAVLGPLVVADAIDTSLARGDRAGLVARCALYAAIVLAQWVAGGGSRLVLEVVAQRAMLALKERLFDHLAGQDVAFFDRTASGSLIGRVQGDVEALRVLFVEVVLALPADALLAAGMVAVLVLRTPAVAVPVLLVLPLYGALFALFRWVAPRHFLRQRKVVAALTGRLAETVRALPALRALGRGAWARDRADATADDARRADVASHFQPIWYFNSAQALRALATVAVLLSGGALVADGRATVGALVMGLVYLRQLFQPLLRVSNQLATVERARAATVRLGELLDARPRLVDPPDPVPWPGLARGVRLEAVSFAYVEGVPVLRGLELDVPAGARVGIVGATGAGKSTVLDLLLRFRDPVEGRVTVDGVDVRRVALADVRRRTGLVLQDVRLLPGTVLDNLGGDAQAAQAALEALGIAWALDRRVDEAALSRGERQLLTFARALVGNPDLLVLDEATSAVDPVTEARVQRALERLMEGRTVVIVAHRLETVRRCDRIYVLDGGAVREQGTHEELLARGGAYAALVRLQEAA